MATEGDVVNVLRYMSAAWPRYELSEQTVAVYVMHMLRTGLGAEVLLLAAMNLIDTTEFFPSVAEFRNEADRIEGERIGWLCTANYRLWGHDLPPELRLPPGMAERVLGYELELLEASRAI